MGRREEGEVWEEGRGRGVGRREEGEVRGGERKEGEAWGRRKDVRGRWKTEQLLLQVFHSYIADTCACLERKLDLSIDNLNC